MAAPNREIVNINLSFNLSAMFNLVKTNIFSENVNMDKPRRRFLLLSPNISKATLTYSDTLLIPYVDRIEAQNDNFF